MLRQIDEPSKNRCYESMTRIPLAHWTVRVWCTESQVVCGPDEHVLETVMRAAVCDIAEQPESISRALDRIANVAAYEILDLNGNGAVVYPDWR